MTARARGALALVTAGAALLAPVAPSLASGGGSRQAPPPWVKINRGDVDIVVEPGLLRTRDGVLHVADPRAAVSML